MTVTAERPRAHVLADLAEFNHIAKRLVCVDPCHADAHAEINRCLDELGL